MEEWVDLASAERCAEVYAAVARELCADRNGHVRGLSPDTSGEDAVGVRVRSCPQPL